MTHVMIITTADIRGSKASRRSAALSGLLDTADAPTAEGFAIAAVVSRWFQGYGT
jgi:hypothetical protein